MQDSDLLWSSDSSPKDRRVQQDSQCPVGWLFFKVGTADLDQHLLMLPHQPSHCTQLGGTTSAGLCSLVPFSQQGFTVVPSLVLPPPFSLQLC